jgi:molecular chaperone HtpG
MTAPIEQFEYKAEMKRLLHLIIHSLYTHPEVFLRELVSNASDALNKVRFLQLGNRPLLQPETELKITLSVDEKTRVFTIEDTGIGMTHDDLVNRIGTVASSGTMDFLARMKEENAAGKDENAAGAADLIGQFGVGFYSVFMVAEQVTIETRHADPDSQAWRWTSAGEGTFSIEACDRAPRGTRISFVLKEDAKEFAADWRIRGIVKKYSNFVDFPIFLGSEQINTVAALWHRPKDGIEAPELEEFYKFVSGDFEAPLGHLHLAIEGRINFRALLFIPASAPPNMLDVSREKSLHLYANRVFIEDDCRELLPDYLRFLKGVVDTEDLPLNVSREVTQSSPVTARIREVLTARVLGLLEDWANSDPDRFATFSKNLGAYLKAGVASDFTNRERLAGLLRFETTRSEGAASVSLRSYVTAMRDDQHEIYYLAGENRAAVTQSPKLEYFRKNDIEVILLTEGIDMLALPSLGEFDGKKILSAEKADLALKPDTAAGDEGVAGREAKDFLLHFKQTLGDSVEDVVESRRLVDSAATLVTGSSAMDAQMERMLKMMDRQFKGQKRFLEVNLRHPLIVNLARMHAAGEDPAFVALCMEQIYEGAVLLEDPLPSPADFVRRMNEVMQRATGKA